MRIIKKQIIHLLLCILCILCILPIGLFLSCISPTESSSISSENEYMGDTIRIETYFVISLKPKEEKYLRLLL